MADRLVQCPACSRHVKSRDPACPFCGAHMAGARAPARTPFLRLKTAAAVAAGVAALATCADTEVLLPSQTRSNASDDAAGGDDGSGFQPEPDPSGVVFYGSAGGGGVIELPDATLAPPDDAAADGAPDGASLESSDGGRDAEPDASSDGAVVDGADGA
jgi:hypothetical protein